MKILPFSSADEAEENVGLLHRSFSFLEICEIPGDGTSPTRITLQRMTELVGRLFGYRTWDDLKSAMLSRVDSEYLDSLPNYGAVRFELAVWIYQELGKGSPVETIDRALAISAFGRAPYARVPAQRFLMQMSGMTSRQWDRLIYLESNYARVMRYPMGRSTYELKMLEYHYRRDVAEVLGQALPKKPSRPRQRTGP